MMIAATLPHTKSSHVATSCLVKTAHRCHGRRSRISDGEDGLLDLFQFGLIAQDRVHQ
jgi:hypothetical protein